MTPRTQATPVATPTGPPEAPGSSSGATLTPPSAFPPTPMGFYTDTTVCIGCKACEVACKSWNGLQANAFELSGESYDNTLHLSGENWRHVKFIEQFPEDRVGGRWLLMSDVCKHCVHAGCLEVCPTGAIIRTEYDTVVIQADVCNGCRDCIAACPFGVIEINPVSHTAMKCTLCYDRMQNGLTPACAQACPTASIQFGTIEELQARANDRVQQLNSQAEADGRPADAYLYGADDAFLGGLNSFYLLVDEPHVYGLPAKPKLPSRDIPASSALGVGGALGLAALGAVAFRKRRMDEFAREGETLQSGGEGEGGDAALREDEEVES